MKIAFLCPYPVAQAPSQRFRFEQYFGALEKQQFGFQQLSFLSEKGWKVLYAKGSFFAKIWYLKLGFFKRFYHLTKCYPADFVFIHRELSPLGPPIFEWILAKLMRKKIIYDFDDAIWIPNTSEQNRIAAAFKFHGKVKYICKWAEKISAGNAFLAEFASQFNTNVVVNPTTIETQDWHNPARYKKQANKPLVIGWTGTHSTLIYLEEVLEVLKKLARQFEFELHIIANQPPAFELEQMKFIKWTREKEIQDLMRFDIGLMPLTPDAWSEGKCGFKALQYMALEIPTLASPVGVNKQLIEQGKTGFLCQSAEEWEACLIQLMQDAGLRLQLGQAARKKVVADYSVEANLANFLGLFNSTFVI